MCSLLIVAIAGQIHCAAGCSDAYLLTFIQPWMRVAANDLCSNMGAVLLLARVQLQERKLQP